jgi:hypothetical protein
MAYKLTEQDGRRALKDHLLEKASKARQRYGPTMDDAAIMRLLDDRDFVRYPVGVRFDATGLETGEFAHAMALGEHPKDGFCLFIHPTFEHRRDLWPLLIAYHLPPVNYGDIADAADCELFGAAMLGLEVDDYYSVLCDAADSIPAPPAPSETPS